MIFWRQTLVYRDCFVYNKVVWYVRLKESDCSIKEKVKKYSKDGMICCGIITIISIVGFIFITIFDRNISDIAVFGVIFVLLIVTCVYGFVKFYKQFNNPNNKKVNNNTIQNGIGILQRQIIAYSIIKKIQI